MSCYDPLRKQTLLADTLPGAKTELGLLLAGAKKELGLLLAEDVKDITRGPECETRWVTFAEVFNLFELHKNAHSPIRADLARRKVGREDDLVVARRVLPEIHDPRLHARLESVLRYGRAVDFDTLQTRLQTRLLDASAPVGNQYALLSAEVAQQYALLKDKGATTMDTVAKKYEQLSNEGARLYAVLSNEGAKQYARLSTMETRVQTVPRTLAVHALGLYLDTLVTLIARRPLASWVYRHTPLRLRSEGVHDAAEALWPLVFLMSHAVFSTGLYVSNVL